MKKIFGFLLCATMTMLFVLFYLLELSLGLPKIIDWIIYIVIGLLWIFGFATAVSD